MLNVADEKDKCSTFPNTRNTQEEMICPQH